MIAGARRLAAPCAALLLCGTTLRAQVFGEAESRFRAGPVEVLLRYNEDRIRAMESQIRAALTGALERYGQLFGGAPRGFDGQPLASVVVRVHSDPAGTGRAGSEGGMLQLLVGRQAVRGYQDWRLLLLHEAFHLWSPASVRFSGPGEQWFNEGAAEFYALQTAARLGLVDEVTAARNAATTASLYAAAAEQQRLSLVEAGQQRESAATLVAQGGATALLLLDHGIRVRTANARSMDDVVRWMYANFDADARRYTTMDVARGIRTVTGQDMTEFFARFVMGRLPLPVAASFDLGELARRLQATSAPRDSAPPDSLLLASLGLADRRR